MEIKPVVIALSTALGVTVLSSPACANSTVKSAEFIGMPSPASAEEKADIYTTAQVKYTYTNGKTQTYEVIAKL